MRGKGLAAIAAFVGSAAGATIATAQIGMVPLPFGTMTTAGTFVAGVALIARDAVQEFAGRLAVLGCIVAGAVVSGVGAPWRLALASGVAFALSELLDWAVYTPLRRRGRGRAVLASSAVAAPVDTALFLWIAGFGVTMEAVAGQVAIKAGLAAIAAGVIGAVLRNRQRATRP